MASKMKIKTPLGLINQPHQSTQEKQAYKRIACVFQGGGALGAYQVGAYRAIHERGYIPNYLSGVSIGAINSAIIAGNAREHQLEKLMEFWDTIVPKLWSDPLSHYSYLDPIRHLQNRLGSLHSLFFGLEGFLNHASYRQQNLLKIPLIN